MLFNMTDELFDEICERMVNGESVRSICKDDHMPAISTLMKILRTNPDRTSQYALATQMRADAMFEEVLNIADDGSNDYMLKNAEDPTSFALNGEHVQRSRLRVDTRKWALSKKRPERYGDRIDHQHGTTEPLLIQINLGGKRDESARIIDGQVPNELPKLPLVTR